MLPVPGGQAPALPHSAHRAAAETGGLVREGQRAQGQRSQGKGKELEGRGGGPGIPSCSLVTVPSLTALIS